MSFCVEGPNATCVRDWCRENAAKWMPDAFELLERDCYNPQMTVHADAMDPDFLSIVLGRTPEGEGLAERCSALGIDGRFECHGFVSRPHVVVAGLYSKSAAAKRLDPAVEAKWERWGFVEDADFGDWAPAYMAFFPVSGSGIGTKYAMIKASSPNQHAFDPAAPVLPRAEAMGVAADLMSNSMKRVSFANAKLFFSFRIATAPWSLEKRKALAALLDELTIKTSDDACCWLTKTSLNSTDHEWHYPILGPRQPAFVGAVHVASGGHVWHSVMHCSIRVSEDPQKDNDPVIVSVITTW